MVHIFKTNGRKIAYDTTSGAFVGLSSLANKMMGALTAPLPPVCPTSLRYELAKYDSGDVSETYKQLYRLFEEGLLFCEEKDGACILLEGEYAPKSEEEKQDATLHSESTQPDSDGADGTADETSIDYAAIAEEDLRILKEEFPELYGASDITELDDPLRYAALRDLGLSPREAYLATAKPKRRRSC